MFELAARLVGIYKVNHMVSGLCIGHCVRIVAKLSPDKERYGRK